MPRNTPPSFEDLVDRLTGFAMDYVQDTMESMAARLKTQYTHQQSPIRRVRASGKAKKGAGKGQRGGQGSKQAPQPSARPRASVRTAYTVLGVDPAAPPELLAAAYKVKARLLHPDTNKAANAHEQMQELNAAWEILKNPKMKEEYDRGMGL